MNQKNLNHDALRDFVERYKLRNRASIIHFNALVDITTATRNIQQLELEIMISFDNFDSLGDIHFQTGDLDALLYPTVFKANFNKMELKNDHLLISDTHKQNSDIGRYEVLIYPLDKITM